MTPDEKLRRAIERYARGIAERDALTARLNAEREQAIRDAAAAGMTRRAIAAEARISHQRVQQIIASGE